MTRSEEAAKRIVEKFINDRNIISFAKECSDYGSWFGRYGNRNRISFETALEKELSRVDVTFTTFK